MTRYCLWYAKCLNSSDWQLNNCKSSFDNFIELEKIKFIWKEITFVNFVLPSLYITNISLLRYVNS